MTNHIFPLSILSDGCRVLLCNGLQPTTIIRYCQGYVRVHLFNVKPQCSILFHIQRIFIQMFSMFYQASAFNQPLLSFDTAKVTDVRVYLFVVQLHKMLSLFATRLITKWKPCLLLQQPSTGHYLSTLQRLPM